MDHRDWSRVEQELGELMPKVDTSLDQQRASARSGLANRRPASAADSKEAILEHISKALERDGIVSR